MSELMPASGWERGRKNDDTLRLCPGGKEENLTANCEKCYSREICAGWCASPGKGIIGCVADGAGRDGIVMEG